MSSVLNLEHLCQALSHTTNPDQQMRQQAEHFLKQQQSQQCYLPSLLTISSSNECDPTTALAAAVQLGIQVEKNWRFQDNQQLEAYLKICKKQAQFWQTGVDLSKFNVNDQTEWFVITEQDKNQIRLDIVKKMYECNHEMVVKQYARCITNMAELDYPNKWPNLIDSDIPLALQSQNEKGIYIGLLALLSLVRKYQWLMEPKEREPLFKIIDISFPILGTLIDTCLQSTGNEIALKVLYLICKVFYTCNNIMIAPKLMTTGSLDPWMTFFKTLMEMQIPENLSSFNEDMYVIEEREKSIHWKIKGIASQISYSLFYKYGSLSLSDDSCKEFSNYFQITYVNQMLETHLKIFLASNQTFIGNKCLNFCMKYISAATKNEQTMTVIRPRIQQIMFETLIPIIKPTHADVTLFQEDPIEYIRKSQDIAESVSTSKSTAIDMLLFICMYKRKKDKSTEKQDLQNSNLLKSLFEDPFSQPEYLATYLKWAIEQMKEYQKQVQAGTSPDWRIKEALMTSIGHLQSRIEEQDDQLVKQIDPWLQQHALQELQSTQPFLRARACWLYGEFCDNLTNDQHIIQVTQGLFQQIMAPELPVKLAAALSLSCIIKQQVAEDYIRSRLQQILEIYLKILDEIDSDDLVKSLESIINIFSGDMGPYAIKIANQLVQNYKRLIECDQRDNDEQSLAAISCLTAIKRLLVACNQQAELLSKLEEVIMPLLRHTLTLEGIDAVEESLSCITILLYYKNPQNQQDSISHSMWTLLPQILYIIGGKPGEVGGGFAFEYLNPAIIAIQNYISKDPLNLLKSVDQSGTTYLQLLFQFMQNLLSTKATNQSQEESCAQQQKSTDLESSDDSDWSFNKFNHYPGCEFNKDLDQDMCPQDKILSLKVMIAIFENLPGQIDFAIPDFVGLLLTELQYLIKKKRPNQKYLLSLIQALAIALYNSTQATFTIIEQNQMTKVLFEQWLTQMPNFKKNPEMRRILFGLGSVLKTQNLPQSILNIVAEIGAQIVQVSLRQKQERESCLAENLKLFEDDYNDDFNESSSENNDNLDYAQNPWASFGNQIDNPEEIPNKKHLQQAQKDFDIMRDVFGEFDDPNLDNQHHNCNLEQQLRQKNHNDSYNSDDDSEYDPFWEDEFQLYDSNLNHLDELVFLKNTFEFIHTNSPDYYHKLVSKCDAQQIEQFLKALAGAEDLQQRELQFNQKLSEFQNRDTVKQHVNPFGTDPIKQIQEKIKMDSRLKNCEQK